MDLALQKGSGSCRNICEVHGILGDTNCCDECTGYWDYDEKWMNVAIMTTEVIVSQRDVLMSVTTEIIVTTVISVISVQSMMPMIASLSHMKNFWKSCYFIF